MEPVIRVGVHRTPRKEDRTIRSYFSVEAKDFIEGIHKTFEKEDRCPIDEDYPIKFIEVNLVNDVFLQTENETKS